MIQANILKKLDIFLDQYYEKSMEAGKHLSDCFPADKGKTQIRNLENAAYTAMRFSSIINFIKNQMGKDSRKKPTWTKKPINDDMMGDFLLKQLDEICQHADKLAAGDPNNSLEYRLYLVRGWVRQVSSNYFYLLVSGG